jgi:hypothetical protein
MGRIWVVVFVEVLCDTAGVVPLPMLVVMPGIFGRTKAPIAKPLISPERPKSSMAKMATRRDCELSPLECGRDAACMLQSSL